MPDETKRCTACKKVKPLEEFWSGHRKRYGRMCRVCRARSAGYNRRYRVKKRVGPVRRLSGELAGAHELLGLAPATLAVIPARSRPGDAGQRWLAIV